MKKIAQVAALMAILFVSSQTQAQEKFDTSKFYYGGGFSSNSLSGFDDATGLQGFVGYTFEFKLSSNNTLSAEVGYMQSGDFENKLVIPGIPALGIPDQIIVNRANADGLWHTAVSSWKINDNFYALARVGLDMGDDDGVMIGGGVGYKINNNFDLRGEYVIRDNMDSLQINFVYRP